MIVVGVPEIVVGNVEVYETEPIVEVMVLKGCVGTPTTTTVLGWPPDPVVGTVKVTCLVACSSDVKQAERTLGLPGSVRSRRRHCLMRSHNLENEVNTISGTFFVKLISTQSNRIMLCSCAVESILLIYSPC